MPEWPPSGVPLLAVEEAAGRYGMSTSWLMEKVTSGYLASWEVDGRIVVSRDDVAALLPQVGLLTISEASDRYGLHPPWVAAKVTSGFLPSWQVGGQRLVRAEDVEALTVQMHVVTARQAHRAGNLVLAVVGAFALAGFLLFPVGMAAMLLVGAGVFIVPILVSRRER